MTQQACKLSARTPATVRRPLSVMPLLLLLLFLCCASVCVARDDGGVQSSGVVRELPRKGQSGVQAYTVAAREKQEWRLIRILASTEDLENSSRYCKKNEQSVPDFKGGEAYCFGDYVLNEERRNEYINTIIPAAIKLHRDRLRVIPQEGNLIVPQFEEKSYCQYFTVPDEHRSEGVANADFVLYVGAAPGTSFSITCATANTSGRPIAGAMNYIPTLYGDLRYNVRRVAHEMAHALGFEYKLMEKKKMTSTMVSRERTRVVVKSELTLEKARRHYDCPQLEGMELNFIKGRKPQSHWSVRLAKDELMSPMDGFGGGYYTALTMAFFEDLKYYRANWGMEEPMSWGNQSGCKFIKGYCIYKGATDYPNMFCSNRRKQCTSDRYAVGTCPDPALLADANETDYCSFAKYSFRRRYGKLASTLCSDETSKLLPGSLMGKDSLCLDGENLKVTGYNDMPAEKVDAVCARVSCDEKQRTITVQYKGDDNWYACPEWTSINVNSSEFEDGKIKCPKYDEVCTVGFNGSSLVPFVTPRLSESHRNSPASVSLEGVADDAAETE